MTEITRSNVRAPDPAAAAARTVFEGAGLVIAVVDEHQWWISLPPGEGAPPPAFLYDPHGGFWRRADGAQRGYKASTLVQAARTLRRPDTVV